MAINNNISATYFFFFVDDAHALSVYGYPDRRKFLTSKKLKFTSWFFYLTCEIFTPVKREILKWLTQRSRKANSKTSRNTTYELL